MVVRIRHALVSAGSASNPKVRAEAKLDLSFLSSHARSLEVDRNQMVLTLLNND
jgi:hypothetical protein